MKLLRSEYDLRELPEPRHQRVLVQDVVLAGGMAGMVGGLLSMAVAMAVSAILGFGACTPLFLVAGTLERSVALSGFGTASAWLGALLWLGAAGGLGTLFAALLPRGGSFVAPLFLALLFGLVVFVGFVQLLESIVDPLLARTVPSLALFPAVLLCCSCFALVEPLRRLLEDFVSLRHRVLRVLEGTPRVTHL